jgi:polar amino acid transport system ATP-binding protein
MALLEVRNLSKTFGHHTVLDGVDFDLEAGQIKSVMGPSGCGKSTVLRCINRLVEPSAGTIVFDGKPVTAARSDLLAIRQRIGFVFQNYALYRHLTVIDNVTLALRKLRRLSPRAAADRAGAELRRLNIDELAAQYPAELSGGQRQRVAIARALAMDPAVLFFDEPTSALDPIMAREVGGIIDRLRRDNVTVLCVTHDFELARTISDSIVFLSGGRVRAEDSGDRLANDYGDPHIRDFFTKGRTSP